MTNSQIENIKSSQSKRHIAYKRRSKIKMTTDFSLRWWKWEDSRATSLNIGKKKIVSLEHHTKYILKIIKKNVSNIWKVKNLFPEISHNKKWIGSPVGRKYHQM